MATACFIVRAVFTTCGRNILPAPKSSPTSFIPAIKGPSMMSTACGKCSKAKCKSSSRWSPMPLRSAYLRRSSKSKLLHSSSTCFCVLASPLAIPAFRRSSSSFILLANSIKASAALGFRLRIASSIISNSSAEMSL